MAFRAVVKADSVSEEMIRLPTLEVQFPRLILPEVLTHRVFSRNTASSRAIPAKRVIEQVLTNPAMPVYWGKNRPGMSATEESTSLVFVKPYRAAVELMEHRHLISPKHATELKSIEHKLSNEGAWLRARDNAVEIADAYEKAGLHKQVLNRILEPWVWTQMVVSSTYWKNFFNLRRAADAQPEIKVLAEHINDALDNSAPRLLRYGQWHLPYVLAREEDQPKETLRQYAAARIARVSYNNHDGSTPDPRKDMDTFAKLVKSGSALHGSPLEHIATPIPGHRASNFYGWMQYRELLDHGQEKFERYEGNYIV